MAAYDGAKLGVAMQIGMIEVAPETNIVMSGSAVVGIDEIGAVVLSNSPLVSKKNQMVAVSGVGGCATVTIRLETMRRG